MNKHKTDKLAETLAYAIAEELDNPTTRRDMSQAGIAGVVYKHILEPLAVLDAQLIASRADTARRDDWLAEERETNTILLQELEELRKTQ